MTGGGGGGVMTTSASIGVIYSTLQTPGFEWMGLWEGEMRRKEKEDEGG